MAYKGAQCQSTPPLLLTDGRFDTITGGGEPYQRVWQPISGSCCSGRDPTTPSLRHDNYNVSGCKRLGLLLWHHSPAVFFFFFSEKQPEAITVCWPTMARGVGQPDPCKTVILQVNMAWRVHGTVPPLLASRVSATSNTNFI